MQSPGKIAGGVAHEARNSLNVISALTATLAMEIRENPETDKVLDLVQLHIDKLAKLINDLAELVKSDGV